MAPRPKSFRGDGLRARSGVRTIGSFQALALTILETVTRVFSSRFIGRTQMRSRRGELMRTLAESVLSFVIWDVAEESPFLDVSTD